MKYLVDNGRLVWVMASTPVDAAQMAVLEQAPPGDEIIVVHETRPGYCFRFYYRAKAQTSAVQTGKTGPV